MKQGGEMDYLDYIKFVDKWSKHPGFDFAIIPDSITGTEWDNEMLLEGWFTQAKRSVFGTRMKGLFG